MSRTVRIQGHGETRRVWLEGEELSPMRSQAVVDHSTEFNWGYGGSGPAQLALAILLEFNDEATALAHYQDFKRDRVARWPAGADFEDEIPLDAVRFDDEGSQPEPPRAA
jgi:hypothetical protein